MIVTRSQIASAVLDVLATGPSRPSEIFVALPLTLPSGADCPCLRTVATVLAELVRSGRVRKLDAGPIGYYALPGLADSTLQRSARLGTVVSTRVRAVFSSSRAETPKTAAAAVGELTNERGEFAALRHELAALREELARARSTGHDRTGPDTTGQAGVAPAGPDDEAAVAERFAQMREDGTPVRKPTVMRRRLLEEFARDPGSRRELLAAAARRREREEDARRAREALDQARAAAMRERFGPSPGAARPIPAASPEASRVDPAALDRLRAEAFARSEEERRRALEPNPNALVRPAG